jgi:catechol-2,3-dioxygenase
MKVENAAAVRLRYATVKTSDLISSLKFYETVLGLSRTRTEKDFVQLNAGAAELCIDQADDSEHEPRLIFATSDIPRLKQRFEDAGIPIIVSDPAENWLMVRDPDGNEVVFER